ncbi:MAG: hypothetical protein K5695_13395 [Oscillospiraceae bacterium]|nr:hypothetical protein [Oscillospiraceae bacterium]
MLKPGLYEQVINKDLSGEIDTAAQLIDKRSIDKAEAPQVLAGYLSEVIEKGLSCLAGDDIEGQLGLANRIVSAVTELTGDAEFDGLSVDQRAEQLTLQASFFQDGVNVLAIFRDDPVSHPHPSKLPVDLGSAVCHEPMDICRGMLFLKVDIRPELDTKAVTLVGIIQRSPGFLPLLTFDQIFPHRITPFSSRT